MTTDLPHDRPIVLCNGATVPLWEAAHTTAVLRRYLEAAAPEPELVFYLREACLGREVRPDRRAELCRECLIEPDGSIDGVMRAVVLSAIRGEGRAIRFDSPYTDREDRLIADYLVAASELSGDILDRLAGGATAAPPTTDGRVTALQDLLQLAHETRPALRGR